MMAQSHESQFMIERASFRLRERLNQRRVGVPNAARLHGEPADPVAGQSQEHADQKQSRGVAAIFRASEAALVEQKATERSERHQRGKDGDGDI